MFVFFVVVVVSSVDSEIVNVYVHHRIRKTRHPQPQKLLPIRSFVCSLIALTFVTFGYIRHKLFKLYSANPFSSVELRILVVPPIQESLTGNYICVVKASEDTV